MFISYLCRDDELMLSNETLRYSPLNQHIIVYLRTYFFLISVKSCLWITPKWVISLLYSILQLSQRFIKIRYFLIDLPFERSYLMISLNLMYASFIKSTVNLQIPMTFTVISHTWKESIKWLKNTCFKRYPLCFCFRFSYSYMSCPGLF